MIVFSDGFSPFYRFRYNFCRSRCFAKPASNTILIKFLRSNVAYFYRLKRRFHYVASGENSKVMQTFAKIKCFLLKSLLWHCSKYDFCNPKRNGAGIAYYSKYHQARKKEAAGPVWYWRNHLLKAATVPPYLRLMVNPTECLPPNALPCDFRLIRVT